MPDGEKSEPLTGGGGGGGEGEQSEAIALLQEEDEAEGEAGESKCCKCKGGFSWSASGTCSMCGGEEEDTYASPDCDKAERGTRSQCCSKAHGGSSGDATPDGEKSE